MIPVVQSDEAVRQRIRTSLHESLIVEASAGTGKTSELVLRLLQVLQTGAGKIQNLAAVTFTHKAAGELKLRLRQKLDEARQTARDPAHIANLEEALKRIEEAFIGTIHAFCAQILRERPVEAVVDPAFVEMSEGESARVYDQAFRSWFQQKLNEPSPGLRRALVRLTWRDSWDDGVPVDQLKYAGRTLIDWRDFPAAWSKPDFDRDAEIDGLVNRCLALAESAKHPALREFAIRLQRAEANAARDYDTLEGLLIKLRRDLKKRVPELQTALGGFTERADADLAAVLREEMRSLVDAYEERKRKTGQLDFADLLLRVRNLLCTDSEVREYLRQRFTHLFVDEFQDTDPLQAEILILLSAGDPAETSWMNATPVPGKLFVVGDPKQSVYKFRRADLTLYRTACEELSGRGTGLVKLTRSFRSLGPIQAFVNAAFQAEMHGDAGPGQAMYSRLEGGAPAIANQPSIVALPVPRPYGVRGVTKSAINAGLPETIVAFLEWLLKHSGWKVRDQAAGELAPVQSQHVAILFRRFTHYGRDVTSDYARGCEARDIPHLLLGSKSFHDREEIGTMLAALAAIEWPDDELSVFATLKGWLFAVPDDVLLRYRETGPLHPFRPGRKGEQPVDGALDFLAELHRERNRRPVASTLNDLLEFTRAHAALALRPAGHQALANVYRLVTLARAFEASGGLSFRAFIEEVEQAPGTEAPMLEEGAEGVRIMTVHNAKGLEFPVVILADMTAKICPDDPERYIDARRGLCATSLLRCAPEELRQHRDDEWKREEAEGVRVAYVAATRARDLLVVPAIGDGPFDGWLRPSNRALYPARDRWRTAAAAPGCPAFGDATVLDRPAEFLREGEFSVRPGLHAAEGFDVVWWDPSKLRLKVPRTAGLLREELLQPGEGEGLRRYRAWKEARGGWIERGSRKSLDVFTPTDGRTVAGGVPVSLLLLPRPARRPSGRRFGTLVHAVLRDIALDAARPAIDDLAGSHGRLFGATREETGAAADAVAGVLVHDLLRRARNAERCLREAPVTFPLEDGSMLEGTIDLLFLEGQEWTVADFKTDADVEARRALYERQLQWYGLAVARITGLGVVPLLVGL